MTWNADGSWTPSADDPIVQGLIEPRSLEDAVGMIISSAPPEGINAIGILQGMRQRWPRHFPYVDVPDICKVLDSGAWVRR